MATWHSYPLSHSPFPYSSFNFNLKYNFNFESKLATVVVGRVAGCGLRGATAAACVDRSALRHTAKLKTSTSNSSQVLSVPLSSLSPLSSSSGYYKFAISLRLCLCAAVSNEFSLPSGCAGKWKYVCHFTPVLLILFACLKQTPNKHTHRHFDTQPDTHSLSLPLSLCAPVHHNAIRRLFAISSAAAQHFGCFFEWIFLVFFIFFHMPLFSCRCRC